MPHRILAIAALLLLTFASVAHAGSAAITGNAGATLEKEGKNVFLKATSHTFQLAQYVEKGQTKTVLVEGELFQRLQVTDDLGAKGDETGRVKLTIREIEPGPQFGAIAATRELAGDEIKLNSGVTVITNGCCAENSAETELSLSSLKTLYVRSGAVPLTTYTVLGKPARGRLIAVYLTMTPEDEAVLGKDPHAVAMITVDGEDEVRQRMLVSLKSDKAREDAMEWSFELGWKAASGKLENHTVIDPAKPTKPVFTWKIGDTQSIELPLVNDRLDTAAAKLPTGVTLQTLPP
ncbi:MAG TPA: hypothetical protein VEU51_18655 [Candidatus Acidoferrales bacterium]|nr:hypothetical protein [Candidatus Acidoferrales bacterium]